MVDLSTFADRLALSPYEVCVLLGISRAVFNRCRRDGLIHTVKIGHSVLVPVGEVQQLLRGELTGDCTTTDHGQEVRTALTLVQGYLEMLNRHWDDETVSRAQLQSHAAHALAHLNRLQRVLLPPSE